MSSCVVSILIPVFNQNIEYFRQALTSVSDCLGNVSHEIIVCDDGSDLDISVSYQAHCLAAHAKFIRLRKNVGMNVARNIAAISASGEYLLLLDSDDKLTGDWSGFLTNISKDQPLLAFADHAQYNVDLGKKLQTRIKGLSLIHI